MVKTEYLFRENVTLAYSIEVDHTGSFGNQKWLGLIMLETVEPTPLRDDGSGYDYGTVNAQGLLLAFGVNSDGQLQRRPGEDVQLPKSLNFQPMGVSKHKMPAGNRTSFPGHMDRATGVIDAIFPRVPMFEGRNENKISRDYWLQISNDFGTGAISKVSGSGLETELVNGNRAERTETMAVKDSQGNPLFAYGIHRVANFAAGGQLSSATTTFRGEDGGVDQVVVQTRQISVEQAREVIQAMK